MGGKALPASTALVSAIVGAGRASEISEIVDRFLEKAAAEREHEVAEVRSAIPLDDAQRQRLAEALSSATRKQVEDLIGLEDYYRIERETVEKLRKRKGRRRNIQKPAAGERHGE